MNLEDLSQPKCFRILDTLRQKAEIPVWHDDQQGTAMVTLAGLINALKIVGKKMSEARIVFVGSGAVGPTGGVKTNVPNTDRVVIADATISENAVDSLAGAGSFTSVFGGYAPNGVARPHISPHLKGMRPAGGHLGFKDGHVAWRKFQEMRQGASSGRGFWW